MAKTQDYKLGEFTFPRGWFVVADSAAIGKKPYNARFFGEDVVLFRGESGAIAMLEAYCPHMGTHLGKSPSAHIATNGHLASFNKNMCKGLGIEDGEIWAHKRPATRIMQLPTDGPIGQARIWYSQFFNPRHQAHDILERVNGLHYVRGVPGFAQMTSQS